MPTPSNRTVLRLARGTYSNLNSSVSDIQEGEPCYATDQNRIYIKEGSSLVDTQADVSAKAPLASPTFTGTVTIPAGASISGFAPLASPTFTGTPTVPGYATLASPTLTGTPTVPGYAPLAGASFSGVVTAQKAAIAEIDAISDASTITLDLATSTNFNITTDASTARTLGNPTNCVAGQTGTIFITGAGFSGYGSYWKFPGGTGPTYTATSGKADVLDYRVLDSTHILVVGTTNYDVS